jgi:two-component system sensor histidine kinase CpxA
MKSIYARIFLAMSLAGILILAFGFYLISAFIADNARVTMKEAAGLIDRAASALDQGGEAGLVEWLGSVRDTSSGPPVLVFNSKWQELRGRKAPPEIVDMIQNLPVDTGAVPTKGLLPAQPYPVLVSREGQRYTIYLSAFYQPKTPPIRRLPFQYKAMVIGLSIGLALIFALVIARSIAQPILMIGHAARLLADGKMESRVPEYLPARKDEIGGLARDFDTMALRLQTEIQTREQLLRDISHEVRSPLARMRVALELARNSASDRVVSLDRLDKEILRLDRLIGQVLNLARLDGRLNRREKVDLVQVLETIVQDAGYEGKGRQISVELECERPSIFVFGRAMWIASAFENVIRNALNYSEQGGKVLVTLRADAMGIALEVADRGPGVATAELDKIFEPFYRAQLNHKANQVGDGVGLAIVARVMQLHGGQAVAENRNDGGLLIRLSFPASATTPSIIGEVSQT